MRPGHWCRRVAATAGCPGGPGRGAPADGHPWPDSRRGRRAPARSAAAAVALVRPAAAPAADRTRCQDRSPVVVVAGRCRRPPAAAALPSPAFDSPALLVEPRGVAAADLLQGVL